MPLSAELLQRLRAGRLTRAGRLSRLTEVRPGIAPTTAPLAAVAANLRRLALLIETTEEANQPALIARLQAVTLAYDDVLLEACRVLEVEPPVERAPLSPIDRLTVDAELARAGLQW